MAEYGLQYLFYLTIVRMEKLGFPQEEIDFFAEFVDLVGTENGTLYLHIKDGSIAKRLAQIKFENVLRGVIQEHTGNAVKVALLDDRGVLNWIYSQAKEHAKSHQAVMLIVEDLMPVSGFMTVPNLIRQSKLRRISRTVCKATKFLLEATNGCRKEEYSAFICKVRTSALLELNAIRTSSATEAEKVDEIKYYLVKSAELLERIIGQIENS